MTKGRRLGWSLLKGARLHLRTWDEDTVVYNEASRDTHLLRPVDAAVLERLQKGPANIPELVDHVTKALGIEDDDELYFYVDELLEKLEKLALAERVHR